MHDIRPLEAEHSDRRSAKAAAYGHKSFSEIGASSPAGTCITSYPAEVVTHSVRSGSLRLV